MKYSEIFVTSVVLVTMVASKAQIGLPQVQTFGTLQDGSQQQFYQPSTPVQGLRLQLSNPAALNLLQGGQQALGPATFNQNSFILSQLAAQSANTNELSQQYEQQPALPQQYQTQTVPRQHHQLLQLQESLAATTAQFRNSLTQPARYRAPAPVTQTISETGAHTTNGKTANLLGVAFSPASDVSQFRFTGSFANYSY